MENKNNLLIQRYSYYRKHKVSEALWNEPFAKGWEWNLNNLRGKRGVDHSRVKLYLIEIIKRFPKQQALFNSTNNVCKIKQDNLLIFICCGESSFNARKITFGGIERWHLSKQ